jgi:hypothetical protein
MRAAPHYLDGQHTPTDSRRRHLVSYGRKETVFAAASRYSAHVHAAQRYYHIALF